MSKRRKEPSEPKQPEPHISPMTDAKRGELVEKLERNTASGDDAIMALGELNRATTKRDVAKHQQDSIAATPFTDPRDREASAAATVSTMLSPVEKVLTDGAMHRRLFVGGKVGSQQRETAFVQALMNEKPHERAEGLWVYLRWLLGKPEDQRAASGQLCPFSFRYEGANLVVIKRGQPYPFKTFANTVSKLRNRESR